MWLILLLSRLALLDGRSIAVDAHGGLSLEPMAQISRPSELIRRDFAANATGGQRDPEAKVLLETVNDIWKSIKSLETPEALETAEKERHAMRSLTSFWFPTALLLALIFEAIHLPWAEVDWSLPLDRSHGIGSERVDGSFKGLTFRLALRGKDLAQIYFKGAGRVKGRFYLMVLVWIHFVGMYLELVTFDFRKRYWNLYQQPSLPLFFELIRNWLILHFTRMITYVYEFYMEDIFLLHWRDHLTSYFEALWVPQTYAFRLTSSQKLDNPDQRIHVDIASFVSQSYALSFGVMKMLLNLFMYSYMLISITPSAMHPMSLVAIAFIYSALGSLLMHLIGARLAHYSWFGERCSGDFRSELRRVHEQSETLAGLRSAEAELTRLQQRFERIKLNTWQSMLLEKRLAVVQKWYGPLREVLFMCILAPFFIQGEVTLGRLKQCEMALDQISDSLSFLVENYSNLSSYRAVVDRLYNFRHCLLLNATEKEPEVIERLATRGLPSSWPGFLGGAEPPKKLPRAPEVSHLSLDARLFLPSGVPLLDVHLQVPQGACVLLCGEEGAGKSTVLRALAHIWPFIEHRSSPDGFEDDDYQRAVARDVMLIPQKPSLPPMSLREAVSFPDGPETYSDAQIRAVLQRVGLDVSESLDTRMDVNSTLSGGEFQKLMVAHCLLAKPRFILLDESMAHLSRSNQLRMYEFLGELVKDGAGILTTSHCWQELMPFSHCYTIKSYTQEDGAQGRRVEPFRSEQENPAILVDQKDREIERLREEIRQLQKTRR